VPEEHSRILIDHLADLCCAPAPGNVADPLAGNVPAHRIALTGSTVVEAAGTCPRDVPGATAVPAPLHGTGHILATIHRPENTDGPHRLDAILTALGELAGPVLLPLHPRTRHELHALRRTAQPPPSTWSHRSPAPSSSDSLAPRT